MYPTDLTVAAVVEKDGQYLLVEEYAMGERVFTQPGGHIESDETPEQAVIREVLEETGCTVECEDMIGVYISCDESLALDDGIIGRRWMSLKDLEDRKSVLRSPAVLRCVNDYIAGRRQSDALLTGMVPLQQNVHRILATADLV